MVPSSTSSTSCGAPGKRLPVTPQPHTISVRLLQAVGPLGMRMRSGEVVKPQYHHLHHHHFTCRRLQVHSARAASMAAKSHRRACGAS